MTEKERNAIAYELFKHLLKEEVSLRNIPELKRRVGNVAKEIGFDVEKVFSVALTALEEVFDEQMKKAKKGS